MSGVARPIPVAGHAGQLRPRPRPVPRLRRRPDRSAGVAGRDPSAPRRGPAGSPPGRRA